MDVIQQLKERDETALENLVHLYGDYLTKMAYLLVKDFYLAEEVVQDTFIKAYEHISQLEDPNRLKSWLTSIAVNICRGHMRKWSWKHIFLHQKENAEMNMIDEITDTPEEVLFSAIRNQELFSAIQTMDYKYREVITLYYFNEFKIQEIAGMMNEKEATIKTRLARGRSYLKELLLKEGN